MREMPRVNIIEAIVLCVVCLIVGLVAGAMASGKAETPWHHEQQNQRLADAIATGVSRAAEEASYRKTLEYYMGTDTGWLDLELGIRP